MTTLYKALKKFLPLVLLVCLVVSLGLLVSTNNRLTSLRRESSKNIRDLSSSVSALKKSSAIVELDSLEEENAELNDSVEQLEIDLAAAQTQTTGSSSTLEERSTFSGNVTKKYVYLTFDDGPSENTPAVLEMLKRNDVKATFFVVYNKNQNYYKQIVADGHTLALHTYSHDYSKIYLNENAYFDDLKKISDYVKSITGIESKIVRLPGGSSNTVSRHYSIGIMAKITADLENKGYKYYDWNAQCNDATSGPITPELILSNVQNFTVTNGVERPFIMLLLHNASTETTTVSALQSIIDYYRGMGYKFERITDDTPQVHQPVQN